MTMAADQPNATHSLLCKAAFMMASQVVVDSMLKTNACVEFQHHGGTAHSGRSFACEITAQADTHNAGIPDLTAGQR